MCTVINRLFGFSSTAAATGEASARSVVFSAMPRTRRNQEDPIILPYCPQISQQGSDKCLCDTLPCVMSMRLPCCISWSHQVSLTVIEPAAGPASAPPYQDKLEEVQEVQEVAGM